MLHIQIELDDNYLVICFNGHPPLGVNATAEQILAHLHAVRQSFNGHPPLGVNATDGRAVLFRELHLRFNGHPPLGVNATGIPISMGCTPVIGFNGHPPLGVNATQAVRRVRSAAAGLPFQWAPTLGGECYTMYRIASWRLLLNWFQWAPTLGGECYHIGTADTLDTRTAGVSMGTHPWG